MTTTRAPYEIAHDIRRDWKNVYFGARPYLTALASLDSFDNMYGADKATTIVAYFLNNATTWRGPVAREIKKELNAILKAKGY